MGWSPEGIGWIRMQPADNEQTIAATVLLLKTCEYKFDLTKNGTRLHPTGFGSRSCVAQEKKITLLSERLHTGAGLLVKKFDFYGTYRSGGCATGN